MFDRWIAIVGQGRGGTSCLYYAIVDALKKQGHSVLATYERYGRDMFAGFARHSRDRWVVAKFLTTQPGWDPSLVKGIPRRLQITRDPRDTAVSVMLFSAVALAKQPPGKRSDTLKEWVEMLQRKEQDPHSVDLCDLYEFILKALVKDARAMWDMRWQVPIAVFDTIEPYHVRLEALVEDPTVVSDYLGFDIHLAPPPEGKQHVLRSGRSTWANWFTPRDVAYFRPVMQPFMKKFGYADDWVLAEDPRVDPLESSQYVQNAYQRIIDRREALEDPARRIVVRRYRADHGRVTDALRVARILIKEGHDLAEARERAVFAASGGHRKAQALAERIFRQGIGGDVDLAEAEYWRKESGQPGGMGTWLRSRLQLQRRNK